MFESNILDELFEKRDEEFQNDYVTKYGKSKEREEREKSEDKLNKFIKNFISNEEDGSQLENLLDDFKFNLLNEICFWYKLYYKLGFADSMNLKKQIKEINTDFLNDKVENMEKDNFEYKYTDDIINFLEYYRFNVWQKRKEYKMILDKMNKIKNKYPKVRDFIENKAIIKLNNEELKAVIECINLDNEIEDIEKLYTFILGLRM